LGNAKRGSGAFSSRLAKGKTFNTEDHWGFTGDHWVKLYLLAGCGGIKLGLSGGAVGRKRAGCKHLAAIGTKNVAAVFTYLFGLKGVQWTLFVEAEI